MPGACGWSRASLESRLVHAKFTKNATIREEQQKKGSSCFRVGDWRGSCTTIRRAAPGDRRTFVSIRGTAVSFRSSPNSLTADLRECSRMTSTYSDGMVVYDDPPRRAIGGQSCRSAVRQFRSRVHRTNSLTADLRECSRVTSKHIDRMVVYDDPSRRGGRSADSRVDPRYGSFVWGGGTGQPSIGANPRG